MSKPRDKKVKSNYLTAYESNLDGKTFKTVEVDISKHSDLKPKDLRSIALWMNQVADWMDNKIPEVIFTEEEFKEIITDPMRVLFEALRYETDKDSLEEIIDEIGNAISADMKADELTELNLFEYLKIVNDDGCKFWRNDFINEMIDRVNDPQPENDEIVARRMLYDYINLPDDDDGLVDSAMELLKNKKDKKTLQSYMNSEDGDLEGIGNIVQKLYNKYPAMV